MDITVTEHVKFAESAESMAESCEELFLGPDSTLI